jgi:hypothetical protein
LWETALQIPRFREERCDERRCDERRLAANACEETRFCGERSGSQALLCAALWQASAVSEALFHEAPLFEALFNEA